MPAEAATESRRAIGAEGTRALFKTSCRRADGTNMSVQDKSGAAKPTDEAATPRLVSRRAVLGTLAAVGSLGGLGVTARELLKPEATPEVTREATRQARRFDVTAPSRAFGPVQRTVLHETFQVSQSFAFDNVNRRLFVVQVQGGTDGNDLCISQLDQNGTLVGYMHVPNAGHGVSIGVEPVGETSYLWTEANSSRPAEKGRGTALQRFAFRSGEEPKDARTYLAGSDNVTCATDADSERLLVRQHFDGEDEFQVHDLATAREGDFSKPLTPPIRPDTERSFQGYAFHKDYLYLLNGGFHEDPDDIDSALSCFDLNTGEAVQRQVLQLVARDLPFREPEGMAVYLTQDGSPWLCFGLASTQESVRFANIFYKDLLVP